MRVLHNYLCFQTDRADLISTLIPETRQANGWAAAPFTLEIATVLRSIGIEAPSPIRHDYKWRGRYTPFAHQVATAEFLTLNRRSHCLSGLGSGKSMAALWAADYLKQLGLIHRVLIISPLSTLDVVWGREIFQNFPGRSVAVLHGSSDKRKRLLAEPHDFYVVNFDGVGIIARELQKRDDINLIVIDESATLRSAVTRRWKVVKSIISPDKWVWGLTGSPTPQAPTDAYGICKLITPENLNGLSFTRFKQEVMLQVGPFKWVPKKNAEQSVARLLTPSIRFALRDCIDLPETITQYRHGEMTSEQAHHYKKLLKDCVTEVRGTQITAVNAAVLAGRLLQVAAGCTYGENKQIVKMDITHRMAAVEEIIEECDQKVILFVPFTGALHAVHAELKHRGYSCGIVEGDTSKSERLRMFDALQNGEMKVLVANPSAMAHGISLTAASTTIYFSPPTSNDMYNQSAARTVRPGQTNVTNIVNVYSTKEEFAVFEGLKNKTKFMDTVLNILKEQ